MGSNLHLNLTAEQRRVLDPRRCVADGQLGSDCVVPGSLRGAVNTVPRPAIRPPWRLLLNSHVLIPAAKVAKFSAGAGLKKAVNKK
jgi:hypothetical protein